MKTNQFYIKNIPAMLYGDNADKVCLYIHGKGGNKQEAKNLAAIICPYGFQVLSVDLPEHGERKTDAAKLVPWVAVPELQNLLLYAKEHWQVISVYACSIGAYFSLLAFSRETFKKVLLVSPIVDMEKLIVKMMGWAQVNEKQLMAEKEIATTFGETLSWEYYSYAKNNSIVKLNSKAAILYAGHDNLTDRNTIIEFSKKFNCSLHIYEKGEHWFHTEKQLAVLREFVVEELLQQEL